MFDKGMLQERKKEKMKLEKVREELLGENFAFYDLDNTMRMLGYHSVAKDDIWDDCVQDGSIVYTETNYFSSVQLFIETVLPVSAGFVSEYTVVKIVKVEEF